MAFVKGQPRPPNAGRKKGSKNKKKVARVADYLADQNINPAEEILALIHGKDKDGEPFLTPYAKVQAWMDLLSYCQAKPKEIEIDADDDDSDLEEAISEAASSKLLSIVKGTT